MLAPPVIEVLGLTKVYDDHVAVSGLELVVAAGEVLGLVGPNGAGKTTTMRAIAGVLPPTKGLLRVAGFDVSAHPIEAKRRLALVPHDPSLFNSLTVWEHVELTARIYGLTGWRPRAEQLLERLRLSGKRRAMGDELSRGMQQKVALACAFLHEPEALLLDEPFTGLDPHAIRTVFELVDERARLGSAIIMSSHLLDQIDRACTTFLILGGGRRLFGGTKDAIRAALPALEADASLEEIFLKATEEGDRPEPDAKP